jgi:hypothetical protein
MTYEEFVDFVFAKCMYETIYDDSDGRTILVIRMLDAYKLIIQWQGLTDEERAEICKSDPYKPTEMMKLAEARLKEKNT